MIGHCCIRYYVLVSSAEAGALAHCAAGFAAEAQVTTFTDILKHNSLLENGGDTACHHHS